MSNTQEKLEEAVNEHNKIVEEIGALNEQRLKILGKVEILNEQLEEEQSKE